LVFQKIQLFQLIDQYKKKKNCRESPEFFASLYKQYNLKGAHVIKLGQGNDDAARAVLKVWPSELFVYVFSQIHKNYHYSI